MGKTVNPVADFSGLVNLRQTAGIPDYIKHDGVPVAIVERMERIERMKEKFPGYSIPDFILDSKKASPDGETLTLMQASYLAPFSSLYPDSWAALSRLRDKIAEADGGNIPRLEGDLVTGTSRQLFRKAETGREGQSRFVSINLFENPAPDFPLIVARTEYSNTRVYAAARYAYDAYLGQWYLLARRGSSGQSAYRWGLPNVSAAEQLNKVWLRDAAAQVKAYQSYSSVPDVDLLS